ncbi:MAG: SDR family NAD(P)-dependent oxidoreductase, partial [Starkeya sp.]|nr:SDR family NAD(P)-dependent oxidoreductase [Starkeya sp.]
MAPAKKDGSEWCSQVAFVTGGVTGIGLGVAQALSDAGLRLALSYRNEAHREQASRWFAENEREQPLFVRLDVTDRADVAAFTEAARTRFGRVDVLINNAGIMPLSLMASLKVEEWDRMVDVNIKGVLYGVAAALPVMQAQKSGHFINVASV